MDESGLRKQVNASGFPFQIRVKHEVEASGTRHSWRVEAWEHRWIHLESHEEGFIDLILAKTQNIGTFYMVIECKRATGGKWIFLHPGDMGATRETCILLNQRDPEGETHQKWIQEDCYPESVVSAFCAVPGQSDRSKPMLERIADNLLASVESLADEELSVTSSVVTQPAYRTGAHIPFSAYIPGIVTNSELAVFHFEPTKVDLGSGMVENDGGVFKSVPFVRFRKSLTTSLPSEEEAHNLKEANKQSQRTIFVVHAPELPEFLNEWETV
jgi:hypothetical protein